MSAKVKVIRMLIRWLWLRWPYLMMDTVIGEGFHRHANPRKKVSA